MSVQGLEDTWKCVLVAPHVYCKLPKKIGVARSGRPCMNRDHSLLMVHCVASTINGATVRKYKQLSKVAMQKLSLCFALSRPWLVFSTELCSLYYYHVLRSRPYTRHIPVLPGLLLDFGIFVHQRGEDKVKR